MSRINFYLRTPGKNQNHFSIYKQTVNPDGSTKNQTIKNDDLEALNAQVLNKNLNASEALKIAKNILNRIKAKYKIGVTEMASNSVNENVLKNFLSNYFNRKRYLEDPESAKNKFTRAVRALGPVLINSSSEDEILNQIETHEFDVNKTRDIVAKVNSILKYLKRDVVIPAPPKGFNEVKYLSLEDVQKVLTYFSDEPTIKALIGLSFYSGLRIGETYALNGSSLKSGKILLVDSQVTREGKRAKPKNRKQRKAFLIPDGIEHFKFWCDNKDDLEHTRAAIAKRFALACKKVFKDKTKHCKWHDLRHSYAVLLIGRGAPITLVAQSMGNSVKVCEEYYSGFVLTSEGIETLSKILT